LKKKKKKVRNENLVINALLLKEKREKRQTNSIAREKS